MAVNILNKKISYQGLFHTFKIISSVFIFGFDKIIFFLIQYLFKKILNTIKMLITKCQGLRFCLVKNRILYICSFTIHLKPIGNENYITKVFGISMFYYKSMFYYTYASNLGCINLKWSTCIKKYLWIPIRNSMAFQLYTVNSL